MIDSAKITMIIIKSIRHLQNALMAISILMLMALPVLLAYYKEYLPAGLITFVFDASLFTVFLLMLIRPLAEIFPKQIWLRLAIVLRKGLGVFSAAIVVSVLLSKCLINGWGYLLHYFTGDFWSLNGYAFWAHLGDATGIILLLTSNDFSIRILGKNWKRIQKLSYIYFLAAGLYVYLALGQTRGLIYLWIVALLMFTAFIKKSIKTQVGQN